MLKASKQTKIPFFPLQSIKSDYPINTKFDYLWDDLWGSGMCNVECSMWCIQTFSYPIDEEATTSSMFRVKQVHFMVWCRFAINFNKKTDIMGYFWYEYFINTNAKRLHFHHHANFRTNTFRLNSFCLLPFFFISSFFSFSLF